MKHIKSLMILIGRFLLWIESQRVRLENWSMSPQGVPLELLGFFLFILVVIVAGLVALLYHEPVATLSIAATITFLFFCVKAARSSKGKSP